MDETGEVADAITACVVETMNTSTEAAAEQSLWMSGVENVAMTLAIIFTLFILLRLVTLFVRYIKTGRIGHFETDCFVYNLIEGHFGNILPALVFGAFPGSILVDILGSLVIGFIASLIWPVLAILLPLIGLAYLIRLPIARKQEFVGRLDGSYDDPDCRNGGS